MNIEGKLREINVIYREVFMVSVSSSGGGRESHLEGSHACFLTDG